MLPARQVNFTSRDVRSQYRNQTAPEVTQPSNATKNVTPRPLSAPDFSLISSTNLNLESRVDHVNGIYVIKIPTSIASGMYFMSADTVTSGGQFQIAKAESAAGEGDADVWYDLQLRHNRSTGVVENSSLVNCHPSELSKTAKANTTSNKKCTL